MMTSAINNSSLSHRRVHTPNEYLAQPLVLDKVENQRLFQRQTQQAVVPLNLRTVVNSRWAVTATGALACQQALYASSTLWMTRAIEGIRFGTAVTPYIGLYIGSFLLPHIPQAIFSFACTRWKRDLTESFQQTVIGHNRGHASLWSNQELGTDVANVFAHQGERVIHGAVDSLNTATVTGFNAALNAVAIGLLIDPWITVLMLAAGAVAYKCMDAVRTTERQQLLEGEKSHHKLSAHASTFWDHVVIGNRANFDAWSAKLSTLFNGYTTQSARAADFGTLTQLATYLACAIPAASIMARDALVQVRSGAGAAVVAETLGAAPRIFFGLDAIHSFVQCSSYLPLQNTQLQDLMSRATPQPSAESCLDRIRPDRITLTSVSERDNWWRLLPAI